LESIPIQEYTKAYHERKSRKDWWLEFQSDQAIKILNFSQDKSINASPASKTFAFQVH
jgi:hypothetical protein